ncbi:IS66 family transposase [Xenorhabdus sp. BG5]|uniref:IS66 family transposase n=1 Tax=Xenorhabdus sp. BG5 TaxID=2782014 RepID=UPI0040401DE4
MELINIGYLVVTLPASLQRDQFEEDAATDITVLETPLSRLHLMEEAPLVCYLNDGHVPIDNNRAENAIRGVAVGRKNWLFAGSLAAGQRATMVMSLLETAHANSHEPRVWLRDVLRRLPSWPNNRLNELLPWPENPFS